MEFFSWLQIALVCVLGAVSPGPSLAVIVHNTMAGGRLQGLLAAIGHGLGVGIYALIAVTGLGIILVNDPILLNTANWLGAIALAVIGARLWLFKDRGSIKTKAEKSFRSFLGFSQGFGIAFLNPKIADFFLALFSQFIRPNADWTEKGIMVLTAGVIDASWYMLVALLLTGGNIIVWLNDRAVIVDRAMGTILLLIAAGLVFRTI